MVLDNRCPKSSWTLTKRSVVASSRIYDVSTGVRGGLFAREVEVISLAIFWSIHLNSVFNTWILFANQ